MTDMAHGACTGLVEHFRRHIVRFGEDKQQVVC